MPILNHFNQRLVIYSPSGERLFANLYFLFRYIFSKIITFVLIWDNFVFNSSVTLLMPSIVNTLLHIFFFNQSDKFFNFLSGCSVLVMLTCSESTTNSYNAPQYHCVYCLFAVVCSVTYIHACCTVCISFCL